MFQLITEIYRELTPNDFMNGTIVLQDDADGLGAYIAAWNYDKPIPKGLKLGKNEPDKL